jgi:hypothetical protein
MEAKDMQAGKRYHIMFFIRGLHKRPHYHIADVHEVEQESVVLKFRQGMFVGMQKSVIFEVRETTDRCKSDCYPFKPESHQPFKRTSNGSHARKFKTKLVTEVDGDWQD